MARGSKSTTKSNKRQQPSKWKAAVVILGALILASLFTARPLAMQAVSIMVSQDAPLLPPTAQPTEQPTLTPTSSPDPTATLHATPWLKPDPTIPSPTAPPYRISLADASGGIGIARLWLVEDSRMLVQQAVSPDSLRLPNNTLRPDTGRFGELRGPYKLIHLGSDYLNPSNNLLASPSPEALLVAVVHLQRNSLMAVALDMSGDIQMYQVTLTLPEGEKQFIICYAHLRVGSNDQAINQAQAAGGHVEVMGQVSSVGEGDPNLSDMHIAVIDVDHLREMTGEDHTMPALEALFTGTLPRTNQQYPQIFVRPEDVFPALAALVGD